MDRPPAPVALESNDPYLLSTHRFWCCAQRLFFHLDDVVVFDP